MFQGCFLYDYKGPYFIWDKETAIAKRKADAELVRRNALKEDDYKLNQELITATRRKLRVRSQAKGKEPQWKQQKTTGKLVRKGKARGIDWYRYREEVLKPLVFPFIKQYNLIIQEDGTSCSHPQ